MLKNRAKLKYALNWLDANAPRDVYDPVAIVLDILDIEVQAEQEPLMITPGGGAFGSQFEFNAQPAAQFMPMAYRHQLQPAEQVEQEPVEKEIAAAVLDHCYGYSAVNDDMIERTSVVVKKILDKHAAAIRARSEK